MDRILIVDDTEELASIYKELIERELRSPCSVEIAISAKEGVKALDLAAQEKRSFDLVVTDLRMNVKYEGLEIIKAAIAADALTQVIVITVYGIPDIALKVMELGAFDFLDRNSPVFDVYKILPFKVQLALRFRRALKSTNAAGAA